jgi:C1A family cysteine protease
MSVFTKFINMFKKQKPHTRNRYGWVPDLPDQRDLLFFFGPKIVLPESVDLRSQMPSVDDQGNLSSCVSNGVAAVSEFLWMGQPEGHRSSSRLFIYYNGRVIENCINEDGGLMIRDGIKAVAQYGECLESEWPYDENKFADKPSQNCYDHAVTHKVLVYKRISRSLQDMKICLVNGYPFVFGATLYDSFESDEVAETGIVPMPQADESVVGGHCMVAVGFNNEIQSFIIRNSWGESWGMKGHCFMPYKYLTNSNLCDDRWMITNIA